MISISLKMDERKIQSEKKYDLQEIYNALDKLAEQNHFKRTEKGKYVGTQNDQDFALAGKISLKLKHEPWFMNNVEEWILDVDGEVEDVLEHYKSKGYEGTAYGEQ